MKKSLRVWFLFCGLFFLNQSQSGAHSLAKKEWGAGIVLGEPTGLALKKWISSKASLDFALAYSFHSYSALLMDYKWYFPTAVPQGLREEHLHPFLGAGAMLSGRSEGTAETNENLQFSVRFPVGFEWMIPQTDIGVFLEIALAMTVVPSTSGFAQAGTGIRYFF